MIRYVVVQSMAGWSVLRIGKPYRAVALGLTEAEARAKAKELAR